MLFQVGGQGTRPTFFEMAAAQQLPASLRAALTYSIGPLFVCGVAGVGIKKTVSPQDASFSESLYGLRRRAVKIKVKKDDAKLKMNDEIHHSGLEKRQKVLSVVFMVVLPYLKSKLHSVYNKEREARLQASLWGPSAERFGDADYFDDGGGSLVSSETLDTVTSVRTRLTRKIQKVIFACYPWVHASCEGIWNFKFSSCLYCSYICWMPLGSTSVGLHALGIHVCRATGQELMDNSSRISKIRTRERDRLHGPLWLKKLQGALLSCTYAMLDYAQTGLIAAVFVFKMMEWWYQSAEERMSAPTVYPPPPPPPPPQVAKEGIPLPPDRTICPLCSQKRANPSVVTGLRYKRCPVTLMPSSVEQIRRLFHDV
ncbi:hypothetical protein Patl1_23140 [Pistacia atlantica]|uniref:Uncharacterized protein n=1 Tax=Pistacia atlantica TaxID=434234 RepID=A0ACC0ZZ32_9ROSI|nr:hypothetical protein Patl1_23140 [Pistacia atlantica]